MGDALRGFFSEASRTVRALEFWAILAGTVAGCAGGPWWVIPPCALVLTLRSCVSDEVWVTRFRAAGRLPMLVWVWVEQLAVNHALMALAFGFGRVTAWVWF
jgi:hypothetical protein